MSNLYVPLPRGQGPSQASKSRQFVADGQAMEFGVGNYANSQEEYEEEEDNYNNSDYQNDFQRYDNIQEAGDPYAMFSSNTDKENEDIAAPKMSEEFYDSFEAFMKKPAPKLKKKGTEDSTPNNVGPPVLGNKPTMLPAIPSVKSLPQRVPAPAVNKTTSKIKSIIQSRSDNNYNNKPIDEGLLRQAFAYAESLSALNFDLSEEEAVPRGRRNNSNNNNSNNNNGHMVATGDYEDDFVDDTDNHPHSAPPQKKKKIPSNSNGKPPKKGGKQSKSGGGGGGVGGGLVSKVRRQAMENMELASEFNIAGLPEEDSKRAALDFDSLVANFEQGIMLQKLRAELEESQKSLRKTTDNMKRLAKDTLNGR